MAEYLANRDCSNYVIDTTSAEGQTYRDGLYLECRNSKNYVLSSLIEAAKDKLQFLPLVQIITLNVLFSYIDENFK